MRRIPVIASRAALILSMTLLTGNVFSPFGPTETDAADVPAIKRLVQLETRPGVTTKFILIKPDQPKASVILFAGTHGRIKLTGSPDKPAVGDLEQNFLVRTREEYARRSLMVAVIDMPSDKRDADRYDMFRFRTTADHARDIDAVVSYMRKEANVPVWLVGNSAGTVSAVYGAIQLKGKIDGLVLTSSLTRIKGFPNEIPNGILDLNLGSINIPALVVAHKGDECEYSPPGGTEPIREALKASPRAQVLMLKGGSTPRGKPCEAQSCHGFYGNEPEAVDAMVRFIMGT